MIQQFRQRIEAALAIPIHFVLVTEQESFPCGAIRLKNDDHHQKLNKSNGFRTSLVDLTLYADNYPALDELGELLVTMVDGNVIALDDGDCRVIVEDADDSVTPSPFGDDEFLFIRSYDLRVHQNRN